jgi:4-hydroxy-tetrahydrodipicolinate synthase
MLNVNKIVEDLITMKKLEGVFVATVTPFTSQDEIDVDAVRGNVDYYIENDIHGIIPCGSTGEFASLSLAEHKKVINVVVDQVNGRVPVVCGTGACSTKRALELTKYTEDVGADGAMIVPPFYIKPNEHEIYDYYETIANSVNIPIMVYNNPSTSKIDLHPPLIAKLSELENIRYVKETSGDMTRIWKIRNLTKDKITVFCGCDNLALESLLMGARGWVSPAPNIIPRQCVELFHTAYVQENFEKARTLYEKLLPTFNLLEETGKYIHFSKAALDMIGKKGGRPRKPLLPITDEEMKTLRELLSNI